MSSTSGGQNGGANEDVLADELQRTQNGRIGMEDDDTTGGQDALEEDAGVEQSFATAEGSADDGPDEPSQLTLEEDSIPDDTLSLKGSLQSTPLRGASPASRRVVSRTPSGALQPFERRFESRFSASPSPSPRAGSPAFLGPHSRQVSLSSQISQISSQDGGTVDEETAEVPWEVIRWTKLRKITGQAFSEVGKRNFGRPTCLAVSALIVVGTSKGLVLGFDYHQTLKIIIGQGTKATECGSVTSLSISADYSTVAAGHANGHIFTWEISRPARPFLQIPPLDRSVLDQAQHPDGHILGQAIMHLGFLGTRHTALVSADAGGMAFSHLATRGLGPVTRTVKTTRLLGRYPSTDPAAQANRKPSSVLAFSPLPLGNVEQATDSMGLTALLTPYLLVIVSTTPVAHTQHKSSRPKEVQPHGTLSGCLAWFPAVKLKHPSEGAQSGNSDTKLVYCWSNILTVLDVKVKEAEDPAKPPTLDFRPRSRWRADEAIVAVQWLGRSVLAVLTVSQRLLIVEDGSLQVTDSVDLLRRHIYHQDLFSQQLRAIVEHTDSEDPSLHGVVADAFYMSFKAYKGRTFLLGFNDLTVGTPSNWADRLMALMENGDHISAIRLATDYFAGGANNVTIGLPDDDDARHEMVRERIIAMISASLNYTFAQRDHEQQSRLQELTDVCFDACISTQETKYLFSTVFQLFEDAEEEDVFDKTLESYVLDGDIKALPPEVVKSVVAYFIGENQAARLEELLCRLEPLSFDLDEITMLCRQHQLYDALIYVWTQGIGDFVTPLIDLLGLIKMLQEGPEDEDWTNNPFYESAVKIFPYLAYAFTGRRYPSGDIIDEPESARIKADLYEYLFAGTPTAWPHGSKTVFRTTSNVQEEPAFPYLVMLLEFDASSFMSMLNEAFEDSFLNEAEEESGVNGAQVNGTNSGTGHKMTRQHIISIMLDVMHQHGFDYEQVVYLDMFIARSRPKYPGQIVLSGALLDRVLRQLCQPPSEALRDDCQLSVEYLLSAYRPPDVSGLTEALKQARFYRVLKYVYRTERLFTELLELYFEDAEDKDGIFDAIAFCLRPSTPVSPKQKEAVKRTVMNHIREIASFSVTATARTLAVYSRDILHSAVDALDDSYQQFQFLRCLIEPTLMSGDTATPSSSPLPAEDQAQFSEQYVQLMCQHDPTHVADYVNVLPSSNLRLGRVLPAMEDAGVVDAAVVLLARDGLARDAMDRLVEHLQSLRQALVGLVHAASDGPDPSASQEAAEDLVEDIQKYTKVGIWLCQGQSATVQRQPRPRTNFAWDVKEDDLDLDEYLWLNLLDTVVQITKDASSAVQRADEQLVEAGHAQASFDSVVSSLRGIVQTAFTSVLSATAAAPQQASQTTTKHKIPNQNTTFLRILRAFLTRATATYAPSLSDLRAVLAEIFSAYTFEQSVLTLANDLLGSDVFAEIEQCDRLRHKGWRPRSQVCEICKRRAFGQGVGERVWDEFVVKEQAREAEKHSSTLLVIKDQAGVKI
ncbi:hypothetical protein EJ03DRAFT_387882 [Teratosphaeria nubilosa]|uniref:Uncharacterized protein n=1 Tax=Teratosphaeria nubilosa TaxID=161662 RepID=A0A6G1LI53_9PEZI|nr:hypothetical protein EJ03DRAFT_387882 [Teratosphaeria nubilosa]